MYLLIVILTFRDVTIFLGLDAILIFTVEKLPINFFFSKSNLFSDQATILNSLELDFTPTALENIFIYAMHFLIVLFILQVEEHSEHAFSHINYPK